MRLADDLPVEVFIRKSAGAKVQPEEIRALGLDDLYLRQVFREEFLRARIVFLHVGEEFREPGGTVLVCRLCACKAERIRLIVSGCAELLFETAAQIFISNEDIRDLKPREVKGLARRGAGDGDGCSLRGKRGERDVPEARAYELLVNLICDDNNVVTQADGGKLLKLRPTPDAPDGIVRAAQDKELDLVREDLLLKVPEIDCIAAVRELQGIVGENTFVLPNHIGKGIVDRLLDQHTVARLCKGANRRCDGKDDAGCDDEIAPLHLPVVACAEPVLQDGEVIVLWLRVAEDAVLGTLLQRLDDGGRRAKVHIGDPEGQNILRIAALGGKVIFDARGIAAVDDFVKISRHDRYPFCAAACSACARSSFRSSASSRPTDRRRRRSSSPVRSISSCGISAWVWTMG